jgi:hypothetical protein
MSLDTAKPATPPNRPQQHSPEALGALIEKQGVRETATLEKQLGAGIELWDSDEEFEEFMKVIEATRKEKG